MPSEGWSETAFSADGRWLAAGHHDCRIWSTGNWNEGVLVGGTCLGFSPDSRILVVETGTGAVRLVDPVDRHEYARLEDPNQERPSYCAFSPDGTRLVLISADSPTIHIWDLRAIGQELESAHLAWELPRFPSSADDDQHRPLKLELVR